MCVLLEVPSINLVAPWPHHQVHHETVASGVSLSLQRAHSISLNKAEIKAVSTHIKIIKATKNVL